MGNTAYPDKGRRKLKKKKSFTTQEGITFKKKKNVQAILFLFILRLERGARADV